MRIPSFFLAIVVPSLLVGVGAGTVACSSSKDPAETGNFSVNFTSYRVAVATTNIDVFVFDATGKPEVCRDLVSARTSKSAWPATLLAQSDANAPFTPCKLLKSPNTAKLPEVSFGERAILVVGSSRGTDLVIGCQPATLGEGHLDIPVSVAVIGTTPPAETICSTLPEFCDTNGQCPQCDGGPCP